MLHENLRSLITGGAGFIGSHLVDKLIERNFDVTVLDNLDTGNMENIAQHQKKDNFHFVKGDIRDFSRVKQLVKDMDAVFNIAAIASVQRSVENPLLVNAVNVEGSLNLLKASVLFKFPQQQFTVKPVHYLSKKILIRCRFHLTQFLSSQLKNTLGSSIKFTG